MALRDHRSSRERADLRFAGEVVRQKPGATQHRTHKQLFRRSVCAWIFNERIVARRRRRRGRSRAAINIDFIKSNFLHGPPLSGQLSRLFRGSRKYARIAYHTAASRFFHAFDFADMALRACDHPLCIGVAFFGKRNRWDRVRVFDAGSSLLSVFLQRGIYVWTSILQIDSVLVQLQLKIAVARCNFAVRISTNVSTRPKWIGRFRPLASLWTLQRMQRWSN